MNLSFSIHEGFLHRVVSVSVQKIAERLRPVTPNRDGPRPVFEGTEIDPGDGVGDEEEWHGRGQDDDDDGVSTRLEIDGLPETGVIATTEDGKAELYAVKYVRISVHKVSLDRDAKKYQFVSVNPQSQSIVKYCTCLTLRPTFSPKPAYYMHMLNLAQYYSLS